MKFRIIYWISYLIPDCAYIFCSGPCENVEGDQTCNGYANEGICKTGDTQSDQWMKDNCKKSYGICSKLFSFS